MTSVIIRGVAVKRKAELDKVLLKYKYIGSNHEEKDIASVYIDNPNEILKMLITAYENNIEVYFNDFSGVVSEEYKNELGYYINDIYITLGTTEDLMVIEVYLE